MPSDRKLEDPHRSRRVDPTAMETNRLAALLPMEPEIRKFPPLPVVIFHSLRDVKLNLSLKYRHRLLRAGGRPFSDADKLLDNDQDQSLIDQQALRPQDSMADHQTVLEDTGSDERHETVPIQPARSARTPTRDRNSHLQVKHTPAGATQKHRNPIHRVSKEHLSRQTRPQTPVGDLGMPQDLRSGHKSISTTARKHQRHRAPRPQVSRPLTDKVTDGASPRSNTSRRRRASHHRLSSIGRSEAHREAHTEQVEPNDPEKPVQRDRQQLELVVGCFNEVLQESKSDYAKYRTCIKTLEKKVEYQNERINELAAWYAKERRDRKSLTTEAHHLREVNAELTARTTEHDRQKQDLEDKLSRAEEERREQADTSLKLQSELRTSKAGLEKLQEKARGYKDFLNKAIEEHQMLYQETKETYEQTIKEVRQEQEAAYKDLQQLVDRERYAREMQNKSFNARKALLEQEVSNAALDVKTLKIKLEGIEDDLAREADRAKDLETQLAESKGREDSFQRLEAQLSSISETLDKLDEKAEQTADERPEITNKLDEITGLVCSMQPAPNGEEIQGYLRILQEQMMSQLACEMTQAAAGRSAIEGQIEILEKTLNDQSSLIQAKLKAQQEQMLLQASDNKDENTKLVESMQSREVQVSKMIEAVTELSEKVQDFSATQELASKGLASNEELLAAQQRLSDSEARPGTLQGELESRLAVHEAEKRELSEKLQKAEQDLRQQNNALRKSEESKISATRDLAAAYKEQHRELELLYRGAEEARKVLEERFKKASSEAAGLEKDRHPKLTKELGIAQQRIVNLTLKLRDRETPDASEQLRQQQNEIDGIWRLVRASRPQLIDCGKVYQEVKGLMAAAFSEKITASQQDCGSVDTQESRDSKRSQPDEAPESSDQGPQAQKDPDRDSYDEGTAANAIAIPASDEMVPDTPPAFKRLVIRSPIEESSQPSLPPSVAQEKLQRRELSNQASGLKSILRKRSSSDVPASGSGESPSDHRLTHHDSRSKFNRPVQSAPRGSQETIADARSSLVGNRGRRGPSNTDLTGPGDWGNTETTRMQTHTEPRTKKRQSQPPTDRVAKRMKPCHAENHDSASLSPSADDSDGRLKNNVRQSGRESMQNPDSQPENDRTSHHFRQGASGPKVAQQGQANTQEGEQRNAKQASAEIQSQIQPHRPASSKRQLRLNGAFLNHMGPNRPLKKAEQTLR
ncbi:hypothetical protein CPLU01_01237 [Colletotrichum plurivorum]|uniref:Uncharacterized protein n=1 Tax=Colletotrichum plurivorum TaxID=2175906 RepID=A0A8H6NPN1_9PEZI|nr:hypothetical protein CPLU01_01237 [Colletotrichum plurivorum]